MDKFYAEQLVEILNKKALGQYTFTSLRIARGLPTITISDETGFTVGTFQFNEWTIHPEYFILSGSLESIEGFMRLLREVINEQLRERIKERKVV